jgi:hypothetical protein
MIFHTRNVTISEVSLKCDFESFVLEQNFGSGLPRIDAPWVVLFAVYTPKCVFLFLGDEDKRAVWILSHALELLIHDLITADAEDLKSLLLVDGGVYGEAHRLGADGLSDLIALGDHLSGQASCFSHLYNQKFISLADVPGTERQAQVMSIAHRLRDQSHAAGEGIFQHRTSLAQYEAGEISVPDNQGGDISWSLFIMVGNFGLLAYNQHPEWSGLVLIVSEHVKQVVGVFDAVEGVVYEFTPLARHFWPRATAWTGLLRGMISARLNDGPSNGRAHCLRENHIGHYVWNELSTIAVCHSTGKDISVFTHILCNEPLYPVDEVFPELKGSVFRGCSDTDLVRASLVDGFNFFPYTAFRVTKDFRKRVLGLAEHRSATLDAELQALKAAGTTIILIGLRLENRMWPEQFEGYQSLIERLLADGGRYHVIFDGHNYLRDEDRESFMVSHMETALANGKTIVDIEREKIAEILAWFDAQNTGDRVTLRSLVPCSVSDSIIAALRSDYFITHWGAGLAKYKWLTNASGAVFSSRDVLLNKADIRIYDVDTYLEDAVALDFIDPDLVHDIVEEDASLVKPVGPARGNFHIDPRDFAQWAMQQLKPHVHTSEKKA